MPPMTSTTRAPPPFNPVYNNPLYPGSGQIGVGGYDNIYTGGQNRAGFNSIIPFNQTRQNYNMPGIINDLDSSISENAL